MGTKSNPGVLDCYANAEPDEPMFILLARDEKAPDLIRDWVRKRAKGDAKSLEALMCADAMERFRAARETRLAVERRARGAARHVVDPHDGRELFVFTDGRHSAIAASPGEACDSVAQAMGIDPDRPLRASRFRPLDKATELTLNTDDGRGLVTQSCEDWIIAQGCGFIASKELG